MNDITKQEAFDVSKKYRSLKSFKRYSPHMYRIALDNGWLSDMLWLYEQSTTKRHENWTEEILFKEASKYKTLTDFKDNNQSAYNASIKRKIIKKFTWLQRKHKMHGYWTKERVFEEGSKYATRASFRKGSPSAYSIAKRGHWLAEIPTLKYTTKPNGFWKIKDNVMKHSKECTTRTEFRKKYSAAYQEALKQGWLNEMPWLNVTKAKYNQPYYIYVYTDDINNVAYVGLTNNKEKRHKTHSTGYYNHHMSYSEVYKYFVSIGKEVPAPMYLEEGLEPQVAKEREIYWERYYKETLGYTMLNIAECGSLGSGVIKWSKTNVFEESRKYDTRTAFARGSSGAYLVALEHNWLSEMEWLTSTQVPHGYWTRERVFDEARKCETLKDFRTKVAVAYGIAVKNGWLKEMTWLGKTPPYNKKWYKETVFEESRKYVSRGEFNKHNGSAYNAARANGWLDEMSWLCNNSNTNRTKQ